MRKIIVSMLVSIDGFTETKDKNIDWHPWGDDMTRYMDNFMSGIDTIVLGRKAFEIMEDYWPSEKVRNEEPVIAKRMNETNKIVISRSRTSTHWENTTFVTDIEEVAKLKQQPGADIVLFGGGKLAAAFMEKGLVDQYHIIVGSIALGDGNPLFRQKIDLTLVDTRPMPCGNVILTYYRKCTETL